MMTNTGAGPGDEEAGTASQAQRPGHAGGMHWLTMQDDLLRSLAHALSNRVGTVMALSALLETGTDPARIGKGLGEETERMDQLLRLLRALSRPAEPTIEPMLLSDAMDVAVRMAAEHVTTRAIPVTWTDGDGRLPVRADPVAVAQAATVALLTAAHRADASGVQLQVRVAGDRVETMLVPVAQAAAPEGPDVMAEGAAAIAWLLAASGGTALTPTTGGVGFSLPGLGAGRRTGA